MSSKSKEQQWNLQLFSKSFFAKFSTGWCLTQFVKMPFSHEKTDDFLENSIELITHGI